MCLLRLKRRSGSKGSFPDMLLAVQPQEFSKICAPLFKQIARCLNSSHFQVRCNSSSRMTFMLYVMTAVVPCILWAWPFYLLIHMLMADGHGALAAALQTD